jgi:maleate cis-trans isomerase
MKPHTQWVVDYFERDGIKVISHLSLEIPDNPEVRAVIRTHHMQSTNGQIDQEQTPLFFPHPCK